MKGWNLQTSSGSPKCRHENDFAEIEGTTFEPRAMGPTAVSMTASCGGLQVAAPEVASLNLPVSSVSKLNSC